jgi:hypothetical protein
MIQLVIFLVVVIGMIALVASRVGKSTTNRDGSKRYWY